MDKKDQIILQQLDVIRSMTENSMKRMNSDFWGTPFENVGKEPVTPAAPAAPGKGEEKKNTPPTATAKPGGGKPAEEELPPPEKMEDLMAELDSYIGLGAVKEEVHNLINMVQVYKLRREHDLPTTDMSLHMVFTGNPGTGKTMMARMMARIYRSLGILSKGQLVEVDRSGLVAGYVGQTALKTQKVIEKAMGGVLFVDEAYALNGKSENDFGQEAIDTLLKAMEDHRDDLVVIVAGYTDLMDKFIHSNPGLESRFNRFLLFEDYSLDELMAIFKMRCGKGYTLSPEAEPLVRDYIAEESADGDGFGNARGVRNIFEHILVAQNNRLAKMESVTREDLILQISELCREMDKVKAVVKGGGSRQESVWLGLNALSKDMELAAIQDGARPLITPALIDKTVRAAHSYGAAAPAVPVKDTIKIEKSGLIESTPDRSTLRAVQTPQVFDFDLLRGALQKAASDKAAVTDDCSAVERLGMKIRLVAGDERNLKVTTPLDLKIAELLLEEGQ